MTYHASTKLLLKNAPSMLGVRLGRLAVRNKISVQEIAKRTGASRTTIYNWYAGRGITNAYYPAVSKLIAELKNK